VRLGGLALRVCAVLVSPLHPPQQVLVAHSTRAVGVQCSNECSYLGPVHASTIIRLHNHSSLFLPREFESRLLKSACEVPVLQHASARAVCLKCVA
jgi:hypothetical protein